MIPGGTEPLYVDLLVVALGAFIVWLGVFLWRNPNRGARYLRAAARASFGRQRADRDFTAANLRWSFAIWVSIGILVIAVGVARAL